MVLYNQLYSVLLFLLLQAKRTAASAAASEKLEPRYKTFSIYRYNPEDTSAMPYMQKYKVDLNELVISDF